MNSRQPGRGRDMVIVSIETFNKITDALIKYQVKGNPKYGYATVAHYLEHIRTGNRYSQNFQIKRHVLSSCLQKVLVRMGIDVSPQKITLNSLYVSGKMDKIAHLVGFDLEYECKLYKIPYI